MRDKNPDILCFAHAYCWTNCDNHYQMIPYIYTGPIF